MINELPETCLRFYKYAASEIISAFDKNNFPVFFRRIRETFDQFVKENFDRNSERSVVCKKGCSHCCYLKVAVNAFEVFPIVDHLKKHYSSVDIQQILAEAKVNSNRILKMSAEEQLMTNIKCPLLVNGECSVYPVRPLVCRTYHSVDISNCEDLRDHPERNTTSAEIYAVKKELMEAVIGIYEGIKQSGYDASHYDLTHVIVEGIENPKAFKRWRHRKTAFPSTCKAKDASHLNQPPTICD